MVTLPDLKSSGEWDNNANWGPEDQPPICPICNEIHWNLAAAENAHRPSGYCYVNTGTFVLGSGPCPECPICGAHHESYVDLLIDHRWEHYKVDKDGKILFFNGDTYEDTGGYMEIEEVPK